MQHERKLIFGVVVKTSHHPRMNELRPNCDQYDDKATRKMLETGNKVNLDQCFGAYSQLETLTGADQWYCNKCKEHRDVTKKLEIFKAPKILII